MNGKKEVTAEADPVPPSGAGYLFLTGTLLGLVPIFADFLKKQGWTSEVAVLTRLLVTLLISAIVIVGLRCVQSVKPIGFRLRRGHTKYFVGYGIISIALVNFLYLKSLDYAPASVAVFSVFAAAPTTTLLASWFSKRIRPTQKEVFLIIFVFIGCLLVNYTNSFNRHHYRGVFLALLAGSCYGLFSIFGRKVCDQYNSHCLLFWQFAFAASATIVFYLAVPNYHFVFGQLWRLVTVPNLNLWLGAIGIGALTTFFPYWFYALGLRQGLKPTTASALTLLEPVAAAIFAWCFLGQNLRAIQCIGCAIVLWASFRLSVRAVKTIAKPPTMW